MRAVTGAQAAYRQRLVWAGQAGLRSMPVGHVVLFGKGSLQQRRLFADGARATKTAFDFCLASSPGVGDTGLGGRWLQVHAGMIGVVSHGRQSCSPEAQPGASQRLWGALGAQTFVLITRPEEPGPARFGQASWCPRKPGPSPPENPGYSRDAGGPVVFGGRCVRGVRGKAAGLGRLRGPPQLRPLCGDSVKSAGHRRPYCVVRGAGRTEHSSPWRGGGLSLRRAARKYRGTA